MTLFPEPLCHLSDVLGTYGVYTLDVLVVRIHPAVREHTLAHRQRLAFLTVGTYGQLARKLPLRLFQGLLAHRGFL